MVTLHQSNKLSVTRARNALLFVVAGFACISCGGASKKPVAAPGGGSSAIVAVTAGNVLDVVSEASVAMMQAHDVIFFAGAQGDQWLVGHANGVAGAAGIVGLALTQWRALAERADITAATQASTTRALVALPAVNCTGGGTLAVNFSDADSDGRPSNGDSATFAFAGCVDDGFTATGTMALNNVTLTGTPSTSGTPWTFKAGMVLTNLSLEQEVGAMTANGAAAIEWQRSNVYTQVGKATFANMTVSGHGVTSELKSATMETTENEFAATSSLSLNGAISTGRVGAIDLATTKPMLMIRNLPHPAAGDLTIRALGAVVNVYTRDTATVDVDLDSNGDGSRDETLRTSWELIHKTTPDVTI